MTAHRRLIAKGILFSRYLVALSALVLVQSAVAVPAYKIVPVGLDDLEHTRDDGYKYSITFLLNEAGQVSGRSDRYNGGSIPLGTSAWFYDGATTIKIGFTGPEHTRNDGYKRSETSRLNEAGQVIGSSYRYIGENFWGSSAWLYNSATTIEIGLTEGEHTGSDGSKFSSAHLLNEAGQVAGTSVRYNGIETSFGRSAWFYDGANTIKIGLVGAEHTRSDGGKVSSVAELNDAGRVTGRSNRYNGSSTQLGESVWLYNGAATIDIGLTGSEHTRSDGYKYSYVVQLNEAGQVTGYSDRFNGGSSRGRTAWLYDGSITFNIGLTGIVHTRSNGYRFSEATQLNKAGQVIGDSNRYNAGSGDWGQSAWLYNGATTIEISLMDSEHTRNDGYRSSETHILNEAGQVIGRSTRFNGSSLLGFSSWFYDGATTVKIGLTGSEHTRNDGLMTVTTAQLNDAGQAIGGSNRYGGSTYLGQDAWFYDSVLDQTFSLDLSTRSDGYAYSEAQYLGDDGLTLGTYTLFDALDNDLGQRAFYFTMADGLHDLGSLVDGGFTANGWDSLASAIGRNGLGQILGHGMLTSQSGGQVAYLLTPSGDIPEPETALLLLLAVAGGLIRRRAF